MFFEHSCYAIYQYTHFIVDILANCNIQRVGEQLLRLFDSIREPNTSSPLLRIHTKGRRTNTGRNGSTKVFQSLDKYMSIHTASKETLRNFIKYPRTDTIPIHVHATFASPSVIPRRGQGNRLAAAIRTQWVDPDTNRIYKPTMYKPLGPNTWLTADDAFIRSLYLVYGASIYWTVHTGTIEVDSCIKAGFKTAYEDGRVIAYQDDEFELSNESFAALYKDVKALLYALKIMSHPDKIYILSARTQDMYAVADKNMLRTKAEELYEMIHEPAIDMLVHLRGMVNKRI